MTEVVSHTSLATHSAPFSLAAAIASIALATETGGASLAAAGGCDFGGG